MHFSKWQACGNDYLFIDGRTIDIEPIVSRSKEITDRHFGIGADGLIFLMDSGKADFKMRIFNADGSEAEMCGNGIRSFSKWVYAMGLIQSKTFSIETKAGILYPHLLDDGLVRVDMGIPRLEAKDIPVVGFGTKRVIEQPLYCPIDKKDYSVTCVSMGNPHGVIFVDNAERVPLTAVGPWFENNEHFPQKVNVEFVSLLGSNQLRMRVWERGSGITMACGTGACASVVAASLLGKVKKEADVVLDGGMLHIEWEGLSDSHVYMTGPAEFVFEGEYSLEGER